jgi:hypothetical protein
MRPRIVVCGAVAQKPFQAGHTWQYLQYLLGFRRLGYDVLLLDRLEGEIAANDRRLAYLADALGSAGLDGAWSVALDDGHHAGMPRRAALDFVSGTDLLLNVMGYCTDEAVLSVAPRRVFLDTDPGFGQMWHALGLADIFTGHDVHVTIAERIGAADCPIPDCGIEWVTTRQPVVLDSWPAVDLPRGPVTFSSVASWRGAYGPVDYDGHRYGLRVHEFRRFMGLPRATRHRFDLAVDMHPADSADRLALEAARWRLVKPSSVASSPDEYRRFVQRSSAELMVAKGMYVDTRSGWFSERSACYLASGRPVLAQDTGLRDLYPVGEGLLAFSTFEEAVGAVEAIAADRERHAAAARALAEEYFDSDRVLKRLLDLVDAAVPGELRAAG